MTGTSGKSALVTGGGAGIGRGISLELAKAGAMVMVSDIDLDAAAATSAQIREGGGTAECARVDVANSESVEALIGKTIAAFGRIDILVNNAGVISTHYIVDLKEEEWDRVHGVNLKGVFLCTRAAARRMIARGGGGRIVNIASEAGKAAFATGAHYCASKAGVIAFTRSAALELAPHRITVNSVCPGNVDTQFFRKSVRAEADVMGISEDERLRFYMNAIPLGRLESPEDVAKAVVFLCSDEASYITGEDMNVTGGSTMY